MASPIGQQTGAADQRSHNAEAKRILVDLGLISHTDEMNAWEQQFVEQMYALVEDDKFVLTGKQLFKLRDLKDRYCL